LAFPLLLMSCVRLRLLRAQAVQGDLTLRRLYSSVARLGQSDLGVPYHLGFLPLPLCSPLVDAPECIELGLPAGRQRLLLLLPQCQLFRTQPRVGRLARRPGQWAVPAWACSTGPAAGGCHDGARWDPGPIQAAAVRGAPPTGVEPLHQLFRLVERVVGVRLGLLVAGRLALWAWPLRAQAPGRAQQPIRARGRLRSHRQGTGRQQRLTGRGRTGPAPQADSVRQADRTRVTAT
jgi:hypothetical protein